MKTLCTFLDHEGGCVQQIYYEGDILEEFFPAVPVAEELLAECVMLFADVECRIVRIDYAVHYQGLGRMNHITLQVVETLH